MVSSKSIATSNTSTDFSSRSKEIRNFDVKDDSVNFTNGIFENLDANDFDVWLITAPKHFPQSQLKNIHLVPDTSIILNSRKRNQAVKEYVCDSRSSSSSSKSLIVPSGLDDSVFCCKKINAQMHISENIESSLLKPNFKNCIQRPPAPSISDGLCERLKLFGWHEPHEIMETSRDQTEKNTIHDPEESYSSPKKRKKEKKKHKKEKKNKKRKSEV